MYDKLLNPRQSFRITLYIQYIYIYTHTHTRTRAHAHTHRCSSWSVPNLTILFWVLLKGNNADVNICPIVNRYVATSVWMCSRDWSRTMYSYISFISLYTQSLVADNIMTGRYPLIFNLLYNTFPITQRLLSDNTQHSQTDIHATGGIRTRNLSKRAAADLRLWPRGYRYRPYYTCIMKIICQTIPEETWIFDYVTEIIMLINAVIFLIFCWPCISIYLS